MTPRPRSDTPPPSKTNLASRFSRLVASTLDGVTAGACAALSAWLGSETPGTLCWVAVYIYLMTERGQTPGKAMMGIRISCTDGRPVGLLRGGILRNITVPALVVGVMVLLARWFPERLAGTSESTLYGLIGALMLTAYLPIFGPRRRALHDYLAGTIVVRAR